MSREQDIDLPPDRSALETEHRNCRTTQLHNLSIADCVKVINEEDSRIHSAMQEAEGAITLFIEEVEPRFVSGGRLIYIGAGTSGRLGVLDASEIPPTFQADANRIVAIIAGGDSALRTSSEGKEDDRCGAHPELKSLSLADNDTVLGIAAGGTTPYVIGAIEYAKQNYENICTGLLTCCKIEKPPYVDHLIAIKTGPEILTGSTRMKAGTATKLALNTISTTLMIRSGKVYENLMVDLRATNDKLIDRAARIVADLTGRDRNDCFDLITEADGSVKTAVVMHYGELHREQAEALLAENKGRLALVLNKLKE